MAIPVYLWLEHSRRRGVENKMIKIALALALLASASVSAMQMEDFIQQHYDDAGQEKEVNQDLTPSVIIGNQQIVMELQTIKDIQKLIKAPLRESRHYSWLCVRDKKEVSYAFISDNIMGRGNLTSVALLENGEGCEVFNGKLSITVKDVPLLSATTNKLIKIYGQIADTYYNYKPVKDGFTQANTIQYFPDEKGVIIYQITTN